MVPIIFMLTLTQSHLTPLSRQSKAGDRGQIYEIRDKGLSQRGGALHREAGPLTERLGFTQRHFASHKEAGPNVYKTQVRISHRKAISSFACKLSLSRVARLCYICAWGPHRLSQ